MHVIAELLIAVGDYALRKGEAWRSGEGAEIMDAYQAAASTAPVIRESRWVNVYDGWYSREEADRIATIDRTSIVEIIYENGRPVDVKLHKVDGGGDARD